MGPLTVGFGILFIILGLVGYLPHRTSITALIPAFFGVAFVLLGLLASIAGAIRMGYQQAGAAAEQFDRMRKPD